MAVIESASLAIRHFINSNQNNLALNALTNLEELNALLHELASPLTGAIIPDEQATRPPKILIDSGITKTCAKWRILQCPGGPLVLQIICKNVNIALWIQDC
jgi:hypothetical protein